ncbi:MAG: hypothetical protein ACI8ZO_000552 [Flavobacteriales bacterium]|jgi:hypothetical protein
MKKTKSTLLACLLAIAITTTGCFGSFNLTNKVYDFNKGVGGEPIQTLVLWGFSIIPVYQIALTLDVLILNTLEYWTGSSPMAKMEEKSILLPNGERVEIMKKDKQFFISSTQGEYLLEFDKSSQTWAVSQNGEVFQSYQLDKNGKLIRHSNEESIILN